MQHSHFRRGKIWVFVESRWWHVGVYYNIPWILCTLEIFWNKTLGKETSFLCRLGLNLSPEMTALLFCRDWNCLQRAGFGVAWSYPTQHCHKLSMGRLRQDAEGMVRMAGKSNSNEGDVWSIQGLFKKKIIIKLQRSLRHSYLQCRHDVFSSILEPISWTPCNTMDKIDLFVKP